MVKVVFRVVEEIGLERIGNLVEFGLLNFQLGLDLEGS